MHENACLPIAALVNNALLHGPLRHSGIAAPTDPFREKRPLREFRVERRMPSIQIRHCANERMIRVRLSRHTFLARAFFLSFSQRNIRGALDVNENLISDSSFLPLLLCTPHASHITPFQQHSVLLCFMSAT